MFYRIFTIEFKISFFKPKKNHCDLCISYENNLEEEKKKLEESHKLKKSLENRKRG